METALRTQLEDRQKALEGYKDKFQKIRMENDYLQQEMQTRESDTIEVIAFLRKEGEKKEELITSLSSTIQKQKEQFEKEKEYLEAMWNQKIQELEELVMRKDQQLKLLQTELGVVKEFRKNRTQLQNDLEKTRREKQEQKKKHEEQVARLEHKFYEEKVRLQKENAKKLGEQQQGAREQALQLLDENTRQILVENRRMAEELRLQVQETDDLQRAKKQMEEENKRLLREVELNQKSVEEYAKQGYKYSKELRSKTEEIKNLENSLSKVVHNFEREREETEAAHARELKERQSENHGLRKLLQIRSHELTALRKLSKVILQERSQTERFFMEALDTVRKQLAASSGGGGGSSSKLVGGGRRNSKLTGNSKLKRGKGMSVSQVGQGRRAGDETGSGSVKGKDGEMDEVLQGGMEEADDTHSVVSGRSGRSVSSALSSVSGGGVDVAQLDWDDKEKVLRLLFAKINEASFDTSAYEGEGWWMEDEG